jgi:methyltransferase (TIGR00027 family)
VNKNLEQKPSKSAMFTTLHRAIANKEYVNDIFGSDHLAEYFLPPILRFLLKLKKIRVKIKQKLDFYAPGINAYMIARTAYFDSIFTDALKSKVSQIVLLGAGYDSRAYRFANLNSETRIFELDIETTQKSKKKYLQGARIYIPEQVKFVSINFNKESLKEVLEKAGYEHQKKTLFIWEGVTGYLDTESVDKTLEFISTCTNNESIIAFDYNITIMEENINNYYGAKEFAQTIKKYHPHEEFKFSIEEGEIESFLEQRGLRMISHMNNEKIEKTYLINANGSSIGRVANFGRFVIASSISNAKNN